MKNLKWIAAGFLTIIVGACSVDDSASPAESVTSDVSLPIKVDASDAEMEAAADGVIASVNPLENDLRDLEVAIRMQDAFRIKPDGAIFNLGATDASGVSRADEEFVLVETTGVNSNAIEAAKQDGYYIRTYKLNEADYDRMKATETILLNLREAAPGQNELTFNATAKTCVEPGVTAPEAYRYLMLVRSSPEVDFVSLFGEAIIQRGGEGVPDQLWDECSD